MKKSYPLIVTIILFLLTPCLLFGLTIEDEKKYGAQIYNEIARSTNINNDPYISFHIRKIKEKLESVANMPFDVVITVIESSTMDAFATIGGYVYITTGLIAQCEKEEELAGVIAHEFAHIYRRHIAKRYEKEKYINIGMLSSLVLAMLAPDQRAKEAILTTGIASAQSLSLKYSREDEDEADRFGSKFAESAGYGGFGIAEFLKRLRLSGADKILPQYLLTHPYHDERIKKLESIWKERKPIPDSPLFPFILVRAKTSNIMHGTPSDEIWINRYKKNISDPVAAYGAYLVYLRKGNINEALEAAGSIRLPEVKDLLYGEALTSTGKFKDAIETLKNVKHDSDCYYISKIFLAKSYEAQGEWKKALDEWSELTKFGNSYPEILYRFAMLSGRMGMEARGFEYLGRYYLAIGRIDQAKTNLEKAISRYGINSNEAKELLLLLDAIKKK